jgi:hypothetical protein
MQRLCREGSCSYPGRSARLCDHLQVVAPHVVMHGVIGQKSADGIVCAGQRINQEGSSPSSAWIRGAVSKSGGNASLAGV